MKYYPIAAAALFFSGMGAGVCGYWLQSRHISTEGSATVPGAAANPLYTLILMRELGSVQERWHTGPGEQMGYVGTGSSNNTDVRLNSSLALAYAVASTMATPRAMVSSPATAVVGLPDHRPAESNRLRVLQAPSFPMQTTQYGESSSAAHSLTAAEAAVLTVPDSAAGVDPGLRALHLIRYLVFTHRSGTGTASDGKKWGGSDAAAVDASNLGLAAFLCRNSLDPATSSAVGDVVRFEAERYLLSSPALGGGDENPAVPNVAAASVLCVESALYSSGETRSAYTRRALAYLTKVLTTYRDVPGTEATPTLFPDFTLQYGGAFSSSVELQVMGALARCELCFRLAGATPPPEIENHVSNCWRRVLLKLTTAGGWFMTGDGGVTAGGAGVSWLATAFNDPAAQAIDGAAAARMLRSNRLLGEVTPTALSLPRPGEVAIQKLLYDYLAPSAPPPLPLDEATLDRSLSGVAWLPAAALAVNRTEDLASSYSWIYGSGQQWLLKTGGHIQWRFASGAQPGTSAADVGDAPAWSVTSSGFTTVGTLRLDNGSVCQAAVYSLPGGLVALLEHVPQPGPGSIAFTTGAASREPDLFRDDERGAASGPVRWANVDDSMGLVALDGSILSEAEAGVSSDGVGKEVWPLMRLGPGTNGMIVVALCPALTWQATRAMAKDARPLLFDGPGWAGALLEVPGGATTLLVERFGGNTSASASVSSAHGAPVAVEEGSVSGRSLTLPLSSPVGAARWEPVTCWLNVPGPGSIEARQGDEPGSAIITNSSQYVVQVVAHYLAAGRPSVLTEEDTRTIVRLPGRRGLSEMHFYLAPGRTVTLRY